MSNTTGELRNFICPETGSEHRIGQAYDERRGVGNGPQICLACRKTLSSLIAAHDAAKRAELEKALPEKYTFHEVTWLDGITSIENEQDDTKSRQYCEGFNAPIDQFKAAIAKVYGDKK